MRWVEMSVNVPICSVDAVAGVMYNEGTGGVSIHEISSKVSEVKAYLPVDDRLEERLLNIKESLLILPELRIELPDPSLNITWVHDDEWATAWKKFFKPLKIGRIVIKPTWEDYSPEPTDIIVEIDPGMAFGTGNHPTTKLCLEALQKYVKKDDVVFDVGTGSGILAMACPYLGASKVIAIDYDNIAVDAAIQNVKNINLQDKIEIFRADNANHIEGEADIVVANIVAAVIISMASELYNKTKPNGILIASGVIESRVDEVVQALTDVGFKLIEDSRSGEWAAFVMKKGSEKHGRS